VLGREKYQSERAATAHDVAAELVMDAPGTAEDLADRWLAGLDRHDVAGAGFIGSVPTRNAERRTPNRKAKPGT
jgi:hypothetical protein